MPKNNEKYGKLNDFMTKLTKPELLFGDGGLFGGLKGNHNILILFARYVHDLKVQNNHVPNTINSEDFIRYLNSGKFPEVKNTEEIVGRIKALKGNIIKDGPSLQENTLYRFAVILDDLGIGQSADKIAGQFVSALENVNKLRQIAPAVKAKPKTQTEGKGHREGQKTTVGGAKGGQERPIAEESTTPTNTSASISVNSEAPAETPAQAKDISLKIDSKKKTTQQVPESITAQTTQELEKNTPQPAMGPTIDEPKPKLEPIIDKAEPKIEPNVEPTVDKVEPNAEPSVEPTLNIHEPTFRPLTKPSQKKIETETGDSEIARKRTEQDEFEIEQPANATPAPAQAPASATVPRGTGKGKRVRSVGGLRGLIKNTERLQEPTGQSPEDKKGKGEKGKNKRPEGEAETGQNPAEAEQANQSRAANEGGTTTQQRSGGSHLGKKLAKLAGAGVAGGTILPLFGGSSEAAVLSGNLPHTIGKILNFITHLFS